MRLEWDADDLVVSWTLVGDDWQLIGNKSGATRLGCALLLKFFEIEARFPRSADEVPTQAVAYVSEQVKVDPAEFGSYDWSGRSIKYHREQIREAFGFREFSRGDEDKLAGWLAEEVCPVELRDEQLREALLVRCRAERIEPPGRVDRIIGSARASFEKRFSESTTARLSAECIARLEALVNSDDGRILLAELRADPGQVGLETLLMLALHLLQSALVHINTLLLQAVLEMPQFHDSIGPDERRALSPLFWTHVNPYGRFRLNMDTHLNLGAAGLPADAESVLYRLASSLQMGIRMRTPLADDADEFRVDLGSGGVVEPSRWEGTTMSTMTSVRANGVELGVETFGRDDDPVVLLAGGPTMLSWPDSVCERLAAGGQRVVRYDLRDCGASTTVDPEAPGYRLRDLAADAAALVGTLGAVTAHLGGVGVGGMVAQVAALDHPDAFSALTLVSTRPVAPGPVDGDLPDHDAATMDAVFSRPMPDWTDRSAVAAFAADGAGLLGNDPEQARATAARIWDRTPSGEPSVQQANQLGMVFARLDCAPRWRQRLGELTLPTLVVHGRADPFFPVGNGEALAGAIPAARLLVLDDMGTALRDAAAGEVTAAMLAL